MAVEPGKIRNVAVVGHRGTGKTSLVEAMLFQGGATNRLGTVESGSTVSDWDEDEQKRQMSLAATICHLDWQERKINLIDTPGDAGFQGDAIAALRIVEGALFAVSGVMGVEVQTSRQWQRAEQHGLSRVVFVNMLDRERADFFRALAALREQLSDKCVAVHVPIGAEHELTGIVDLLHMNAYMDPGGQRESGPTEIPAEMQDQVNEYREKLLDAVVETDEGLMERYLDGQELSVEEVAHALKEAVTRGEVFPVACGVASKNLGTTALLDLLVEGVPSPAKKGEPMEIPNTKTAAFVFKTIADPFAGRINVFRVLHGTVGSPLRIALPEGTLYSFARKYLLRPRREALGDAALAERVQDTAVRIADLLNVDWAARVDFIHDPKRDRLCFLECDVAPLIGAGSAFSDSLLAAGMPRAEQLRRLILGACS